MLILYFIVYIIYYEQYLCRWHRILLTLVHMFFGFGARQVLWPKCWVESMTWIPFSTLACQHRRFGNREMSKRFTNWSNLISFSTSWTFHWSIFRSRKRPYDHNSHQLSFQRQTMSSSPQLVRCEFHFDESIARDPYCSGLCKKCLNQDPSDTWIPWQLRIWSRKNHPDGSILGV